MFKPPRIMLDATELQISPFINMTFLPKVFTRAMAQLVLWKNKGPCKTSSMGNLPRWNQCVLGCDRAKMFRSQLQ